MNEVYVYIKLLLKFVIELNDIWGVKYWNLYILVDWLFKLFFIVMIIVDMYL